MNNRYQSKLDKIYKRNEYLKQKYELKKARNEYKNKMSFSKKLMIIILLNCVIIELYAMVAMWYNHDLLSLCALIGAVVGETVSFAIYSYKAIKENTSGGIVYKSAISSNDDTNIPMDNNVYGANTVFLNCDNLQDQQPYNAFDANNQEEVEQ